MKGWADFMVKAKLITTTGVKEPKMCILIFLVEPAIATVNVEGFLLEILATGRVTESNLKKEEMMKV